MNDLEVRSFFHRRLPSNTKAGLSLIYVSAQIHTYIHSGLIDVKNILSILFQEVSVMFPLHGQKKTKKKKRTCC